MGCPFAHLAALASGSKVDDHHGKDVHSQLDGTTSLSKALREGTAASHRQVEKSKGVGMLLHSVTVGGAEGEDALHFDRKDYVRWLVMLASIYITLEAGLHRAQTSDVAIQAHSTIPLLQPLLDSGLPALLGRTRTLLLDIAAHLATLDAHHGTQLDDIVQETHDVFLTESAEVIDREDATIRSDLARIVLSLQAEALAVTDSGATTNDDIKLSQKHVDLLTPAQVHATHAYVRHLDTLTSRSDTAGLVLSHAYTRYLGDLSGGQHILKKVAKKWPCDLTAASSLGDGFEFYRFEGDAVEPARSDAPSRASSGTKAAVAKDLKTTFRECMDGGLESHVTTLTSRAKVLSLLVAEANVSFEQNAALFESLLPVQHRMVASLSSSELDHRHHHDHHHHHHATSHHGLSAAPAGVHRLLALAMGQASKKHDGGPVNVSPAMAFVVLLVSLLSAVMVRWAFLAPTGPEMLPLATVQSVGGNLSAVAAADVAAPALPLSAL